MPITRRVLGALALLAISLAASSALSATEGAVTLTQPSGETLLIPGPAKRLVTLSPHLTELVFAAGGGDLVVATVEYSQFPAPANEIPRVGNAFRIDVEQVHQLKPDLVLGWQSGNPAAALARLAELGLPVWSIEIRSPGQIADTLEAIGRAIGTQAAAEPAANALRDRLEALENSQQEKAPVSYFYQVSPRPLYTVNGEHLITQGLAYCGGRNVFADLTGLAPQVGQEAVLLADPEVLIAPDIPGAEDPFAQWKSWPRMAAVRHANYLLLPADAISQATPRFLDAVELACRMMDDLRQTGEAQ